MSLNKNILLQFSKKSVRSQAQIRWFVAIICALILIDTTVMSASSWIDEKNNTISNLTSMAALEARAIDVYFSHIESSLKVLADELPRQRNQIDLTTAFQRVKKFKELHPELYNVTLIRSDGEILFTAKSPPGSVKATLANEASFLAFLEGYRQGTAFEVGQPLVGAISKVVIVPIRLALQDAQGQLQYVLSINLPEEYLRSLWTDAPITQIAAVGLMRDNGYLLSRYPIPATRSLAEVYGQPRTGTLIGYLRQQNFPDEGYIEGTSSVDDKGVLNVFRRLPNYPATLFIAMPENQIRALWWARVKGNYGVIAVLLAGLYFTYRFLMRRQREWDSAQAKLEAAQQDNDRQFRSIIEASPVPTAVNDNNMNIVYLNASFTQTYGYTLQEIPTLAQWWPLAYPDPDYRNWVLGTWQTRLEQAFKQHQPFEAIEVRVAAKSGEIRTVLASAVSVDDSPNGFHIVTLYDITERKRIEEALARSEARYARVFEGSELAFWDWNMQTGEIIVSPSFESMLGYGPGEWLCTHENWLGHTHPDDMPATTASFNEHVAGTRPNHDAQFRMRRKSEEWIWIHSRGRIITRDADVKPVLMAGTFLDITQRRLQSQALRESEERFRSLMENIPGVAVQGYGLDGTVHFWNHASERLYGFSAAEALGQNLLELIIPPEMKDGVRSALQSMIDTGEPIPASELMLLAKGGARVPVFSSHALVTPTDRPTELFCLDIDLSEQKKAERKLQLAASVFSHAREGIVITKADGTILDVNEAFTAITGYEREEVVGKNPRVLKSGRQSKEFYADLWRSLLEKGHWYGELWNRKKNGEVYAEMLTVTAVRNASGETTEYVALFADVTRHKEQQSQLERIAHYDALTGLPNRVLLADRLHQSMAQAQRRGQQLGVAFLDLDGFKAINDQHGHNTGDQLLVTVSSRMKLALREGDTLARIGGDEFVAVIGDLETVEASVPLLARLLTAAAQPVTIDSQVLQVSASIGVTYYPQTEVVDADQLMRQADQSMYQAKLAGKNRYHVFDAELDRSVRGHHESLDHIRQALERRQFVLYYQPKVNMRTGAVIGMEALIRWQHPERGLLPPAVFLPVIEEHPLAVDIGEWVIDAALTQMAQWKAAGISVPVSVNIGARQLQQDSFVTRLKLLLAAHPEVSPNRLELEVLETSALEDLNKVSELIESCRAVGVRFALDDFGTGYSSLTYLKRLKVAQLKIDQSFVRDMLEDPEDLAILEGVLGLAIAFRREVIAEGVETLAHGEMLLMLGCELAQGFGIARPMPADAIPSWVESWRPDPSWNGITVVSSDDLPVLFAVVEHRAWLAGQLAYFNGESLAPLELDENKCQLGQWLKGSGGQRYKTHSVFSEIDTLHHQLHDLVAAQCQQKAAGKKAATGEFERMRDRLISHLYALIGERR